MLIVGNWKSKYTEDLSFDNINLKNKYIICPPYILIRELYNIFSQYNNIFIGAQSVSDTDITGDISAEMLYKSHCKYCIIGHSERKNKENYQVQISSLLEYNIIPILCISSLEEKNLHSLPKNIIIAYEPINNINSDQIADYHEINDMTYQIKNIGFNTVLYGGSVTEQAILPKSIDGVLVGRKSLPLSQFLILSIYTE